MLRRPQLVDSIVQHLRAECGRKCQTPNRQQLFSPNGKNSKPKKQIAFYVSKFSSIVYNLAGDENLGMDGTTLLKLAAMWMILMRIQNGKYVYVLGEDGNP